MSILLPEEARRYLLYATHLHAPQTEASALLATLGCIQLDPLDRYGTSPELVAWARISGLQRGDLWGQLAGRTFEHFAKERCLIHPRFFPYYRMQAVETPWWRNSERMKRLPESLITEVLAEVTERGPLRAEALEDRGATDPMDWSGWKSTGKRSTLALEVLWTRCEVVVAARDAQGRRLYDLPQRALPREALQKAQGSFAEEMLMERVRSAGLLSRSTGPHWSMLSAHRKDGTAERLIQAGQLVEVKVAGRPYLALPAVLQAYPPIPATELRVLAPLDPLLWDRRLIKDCFDFDYVWEVYKPANQRRWGYYVCPLLWGEQLIGRLECKREESILKLLNVWGDVRSDLLQACLKDLAWRNRCVWAA